eukprot:6642950-Karenia_brevis.AAC.1
MVEEDAEFVCSKSLLEETLGSGPKQYEGWLLYNPDEPRSAKVTDYSKSPSKRNKEDDNAEKVEKPIIDLVLLDDTGPVLVTLWGDCVDSFFAQKQANAQ